MAKFNDMEILKRIDAYREEHTLSMNQFSQLCGIDQGNLSKVKNGKGNFSEKTLFKIAKGMKATFEWLTTGCGLCGVEGDAKLDAINEEFNRVHGNGNATVNNVNNGSTQTNNVELHTESAEVLREKIRLLEEKIRLLEERIADKDRIISLLSGR